MDLIESSTKEFYYDYERKINDILKIIEENSGKHSFSQEKINLWINSQLSERRKKACVNLLKNTNYLTLDYIFDSVKDIVTKIYSVIGENEEIYLWAGSDKVNSNYFISILALHHIITLNLKRPRIIFALKKEMVPILGKSPVLHLDDVVYSSSQLIKTLKQMNEIGIIVNLYLGFCAMTDYSIDRLNKLSEESYYDSSRKEIKYDNTWFTYYTRIKLPHISTNFEGKNMMDIYDLLDIYYYFSPYTDGILPTVSLYLDYKIASEVSTFLTTLMIGPVLPTNLHYKREWIYSYMTRKMTELKLKLSQMDMIFYLQRLERDEAGIDIQQNEILSIPFIEGCTDRKYIFPKDLTYSMLMLSYEPEYGREYEEYIDFLEDLLSKSARCPSSFYEKLF